MKKIVILICLPVLFLMVGCVNSLDDYNVDSKKPSKVSADPMVSHAVKNMADVLNSINVNTNVFRFYVQHITSTEYLDEPRYNMVTRTIPQALWNSLYATTLIDLKEARKIIDEDVTILPALKANELAVISILEVYAYSVLVNTFGNIPYTQALDINNPQPVYDDAKTVYTDLLTKLDAALGAITLDGGGFGSADLVYKGDMGKWIKFGNSLKLKMAMVLADADNGLARSKVTEAASNLDNLITSNADNALFAYLASAPNNNPLSNDVPPRSSRRDFVAANTLVDFMNDNSDPRRAIYFTALGDGSFAGGLYGFTNAYSDFSTLGSKLIATTMAGNFLDASEVHFLLAEAVERGFLSGSAEEHYNSAITTSLEYWGAGADAAAFLAQDGVSYGTAGGSWEEKIGKQKWVALYNRGFDAWTEWRRLDFPALVKPDAPGTPDVPTRMIYPVIENSLNSANTTAAASAIGGDDSSTKLFWDTK